MRPDSEHAAGAELVNVLVPSSSGGKSRSRLEPAESLQQFTLLLAFRSSSQKVADFSLVGDEECGKGPKKTFASPTQKLHSMIPCSPDLPKETLGISSPDTEAKPSQAKAMLDKKEKATTENGPSFGLEKKRKAQDSKPTEKNGKEKIILTNAEFEEIVQIVLRKSLQECLGHCVVWVQCSSPNCRKWRRLRGNTDPSVLPDNWFCDQNTDLGYNCCAVPEEAWTGNESEVVYASYVPGSIIWAKQYGYPWWPGMVESDPDLGEYFLFASHLDSLPSKYHVTFFGETVSRAWIPVNMLKNFQELSLERTGVKKCRNKDYIQKLEVAISMAHKAQQTGIQERVDLFGFWNRYCGSDSNEERGDLMVPGANSPESNMEKEEALEMEEKDKKDPTLPGPKSAKIKTKNPKPKGPKKRFQVPQRKNSAIILCEEKEVRMVPKILTPPAHHRAFPLVGKERSRPQEPLIQEPGSVCLEDEASSDLDLEQIMEDIGRKSEERGEL
ncbi:zinc finger CW-type PWWP domain protein 1 [Erethizon dorsatum]